MADIQYDPACMDCRHDAVKDPAGTTWQCAGHVHAERNWLRAKLANVMVEWEHDVEVLTKERNAALTLAEQRGAAYDMTWREVESLREWKDKLEAERDDIAAWAESWMKRVAAAERERDEARARLARIEEVTRDSGIGPAAAANNLARLSSPAPTADAVTEAVEIVCPETLSAERRCGTCPTCRCLAEVGRLRAAIQAHEHEFERLTLRPDPCDYDLWGALSPAPAPPADAAREADAARNAIRWATPSPAPSPSTHALRRCEQGGTE